MPIGIYLYATLLPTNFHHFSHLALSLSNSFIDSLSTTICVRLAQSGSTTLLILPAGLCLSLSRSLFLLANKFAKINRNVLPTLNLYPHTNRSDCVSVSVCVFVCVIWVHDFLLTNHFDTQGEQIFTAAARFTMDTLIHWLRRRCRVGDFSTCVCECVCVCFPLSHSALSRLLLILVAFCRKKAQQNATMTSTFVASASRTHTHTHANTFKHTHVEF